MQLRNSRRLLVIGGLLLFVVGMIGIWRAVHPPLSPEDQIKANTQDLCVNIENRNVRGVSGYFTKDFTYNGNSRQDLVREMQMAFFQGRDVQVHISNEQVKVNGDSAVSTGHYSISFRAGPNAPSESHAGDFQLNWVNQDDQWLIESVKGGINIGNE